MPRLRWLEWILITPALHRVHHINEARYCNSNFGGTFSVWDRLFGSLEAEPPAGPPDYGVGRERPSENPFWASNLPFLRGAGLCREQEPTVRRFDVTAPALSLGAVLLFGLVIGYVDHYGYGYEDITGTQVALFALLAAGAVALGGLAEGRPWAVAAWLLITLALPLGHLVGMPWYAGLWSWLMLPLAVHGLATALGVGRRPRAPERN